MSKINFFIGIDPGAKGAFAIIDEDGRISLLEDMPTYQVRKKKHIVDAKGIKKLLDNDPVYASMTRLCIIEKQQSMGKEGRNTMLSIGISFGYLEMALIDRDIPYDIIRPQVWKKEFGLTGEKSKESSISKAEKLFPSSSLYGPKGGGKDGRAEALLMAEYSRRLYISH